MWKKTALAALAVLALAAAYIRPVYSVTVGSRPLQGSWDKRSLDEASAMAVAAAEEVARSGSQAPVYETKMHLSLLPASSDAPELARELLSGYEGVQRAYRVSVDGVDIGIAEDATAFDEIVLAYIAQYAPVDCVSAGLINDGDADRVGAVDEHGTFVSPHKIIALVAGHLVRNRGMQGRVVLNLSTSTLTKRVCRALGCRVTVRPVGFKHIYKEMCKGDVLIGGEEAGGIGIPAHMRERDGLLVNLMLCELMAQTGKTLGALVAEMEEAFGALVYGRRDLRLENEVIEMFRTMLPGLNPHEIAGETPVAVSHMDGLRLEFADESWLLLRPGGTEPVVRVYAEAPTARRRDALLEAGCDLARGGFA